MKVEAKCENLRLHRLFTIVVTKLVLLLDLTVLVPSKGRLQSSSVTEVANQFTGSLPSGVQRVGVWMRWCES